MTDIQLQSLNQGFVEIVNSPAYLAIKRHFEDLSYFGTSSLQMEDLGKAYLRESGIKHVFRTFEDFAQGVVESEKPEDELQLEPETLEDDALNLLDK